MATGFTTGSGGRRPRIIVCICSLGGLSSDTPIPEKGSGFRRAFPGPGIASSTERAFVRVFKLNRLNKV